MTIWGSASESTHAASLALPEVSLGYTPRGLAFDQLSLDRLEQRVGFSGWLADDFALLGELPRRPGVFDRYLSRDFEVDFDDSARGVFDSETERIGTVMTIGVELEKRFRGTQGPIGVLTLQAYLLQADDLLDPLLLFNEVDDWQVEWRETNFNFAGLGSPLVNVRVGHFDLPFGLEHTIEDNGALRDHFQSQNFGIEEDWGVTLNGRDEVFEYEAGWTRGSGNDFREDGDPGLVAGRFGAAPDEAVRAGLSFLEGRTLDSRRNLVDRHRVGVDLQIAHRGWNFLTEAALGTDEDEDVHHELFEVNWSSPYDSSLAWVQLRNESRRTDGWDDSVAATIGIDLPFPGGWSFSAQWTQELHVFEDESRLGYLALQLRMRR
ncbi:MAG: hypothetical protein WD226_01140 [Planctomycetota bacterium]